MAKKALTPKAAAIWLAGSRHGFTRPKSLIASQPHKALPTTPAVAATSFFYHKTRRIARGLCFMVTRDESRNAPTPRQPLLFSQFQGSLGGRHGILRSV